MKDSDLQKIGMVLSGIIWLIAMKLPFPAFFLVAMWAGVLAFDNIGSRGRSRMGMFDGE